METQFFLTSTAFSPTAGEMNEDHEDFINPGLFALELADFLEAALAEQGYRVSFRCQEDWGHWLELEHPEKYTLAIGCANTGERIEDRTEHRVFVTPDKPFIRRLFKKIEVKQEVEALVSTLKTTFESSPQIHDVVLTDAP